MFIRICKEVIIHSLLLLAVAYIHKSATQWRGYEAAGGEYLLLLLRGLYLAGKSTCRQWKPDKKSGRRKQG